LNPIFNPPASFARKSNHYFSQIFQSQGIGKRNQQQTLVDELLLKKCRHLKMGRLG
jgi:hypothetical protein